MRGTWPLFRATDGFERGGTFAQIQMIFHVSEWLACWSVDLAATLSFDIPVGDVPSVVDQPRLIGTIARDLYVEGVDLATHERFIQAPLTPPDPKPYQ